MVKSDSYHGKNILSYKSYTIFTGKEINDWIQYQIEHETSKARIAQKMQRHFTIKNDGRYRIIKNKEPNTAHFNEYEVIEVFLM